MNFIFTWTTLYFKRLMQKRFFLLSLALIPLTALLLAHSVKDTEKAIHIYVSAPTTCSQETKELLTELSDSNSSSNLVSFHVVETEAELIQAVKNGDAISGFMLPENLNKAMYAYARTKSPCINVYLSDESSAKITEELIFSKVYHPLCFALLDNHFAETEGVYATKELRERFEEMELKDTFFNFRYADGTENKSLTKGDTNYMLLPIRGITAIFILLSTMTGALCWYEDKQNKLFLWLPKKMARNISVLYIALPLLLSCMFGILTFQLSGLNIFTKNELLCLFLYVFAAYSFVKVLLEFCPKQRIFTTLIPAIFTGSLLFAPVFIDLTQKYSIVNILAHATPVYYYLTCLHSNEGKINLLIFSSFLICVAFVRNLAIGKAKILQYRYLVDDLF